MPKSLAVAAAGVNSNFSRPAAAPSRFCSTTLLVRSSSVQRMRSAGSLAVTAEGGTLAEVLDHLDASYSGIKGRILDEGGDLRRFVNVYVGNDDVRFLDGLATATPDGTKISVIPAVAGG